VLGLLAKGIGDRVGDNPDAVIALDRERLAKSWKNQTKPKF
jgi:hypothetical protein